jgi:hypothetical protein
MAQVGLPLTEVAAYATTFASTAAAASSLPDSPFLSNEGKPLPYAEVTNRLHDAVAHNTRMRAALEQAADHIRTLRDKVDGGGSASGGGGSSAGGGGGGDEVAALKSQLAKYRDHLVRARDALIAAKQARKAAEAASGSGSGGGPDPMLMELRARCLELQERCGLLHRDNDRLRGAVAAAAESLSAKEGDASLPGRLRGAERRIAELTLQLSRVAHASAAGDGEGGRRE